MEPNHRTARKLGPIKIIQSSLCSSLVKNCIPVYVILNNFLAITGEQGLENVLSSCSLNLTQPHWPSPAPPQYAYNFSKSSPFSLLIWSPLIALNSLPK